uniref:uncharacterized protein LOC101304042 n=1 Tax=Fragaria vesca subsp. vesca TaxID=101020 RepID=UPI0005C94520|nr:PREDICTED: uncharacterized protein LOC101304042 [Fragaria vesca subsp. vesca]
MVRNLQQLMHLYVVDCGVEEIIEDGVQTTYEFVLSKLNSVIFKDLPNLNCFYPGMHASCWPSLEGLWVYDCSKIAFLAQECSRLERNYESTYPAPTNQALFIIEKDSFPNLKNVAISGMEIWDGPFPINYFSKLEYFQVRKSNNESAAILEKFPGLEKYGETSAPPSSEISSHRKSRSGDIHAVGALSHLSELWLYGMSRLMHLGEDNSQMAGQNFPNLQFLGIYCCDSLQNLRSSAISFKNLTSLQVNGCSGLEYLITYSTAKSLKQLILLSVENCGRLVEIVGSREDDDNLGNEIVFSRLEYLELSKLPRLRGFCSGDCIVKFPSLNQLLISKRLKLKIFGNDETLHVTNEEVDTDVDADDGETYVDADDGETGVDLDEGEKTVQVTKENVDIDAGVDGDQSDETTHITNQKEDENYDGSVTFHSLNNFSILRFPLYRESICYTHFISEHVQPLEITATDQGVIAPVGENLAILPVGEVTTPVFPVVEHTLVAEVTRTEAVEQVFLDIEPLAEEARPDVHQTLNAPEQHVKERSDPLEPSAAAKGILTPTIRAQAPQSSLKSSGEKLSLIVLLFTCSLWICIYLISLPHLTPGSICTSLPLCHVINPFHYLTSQEQVRPFETTAIDQEFIAPVQENLAIIPVGKVRTPVFPVIEPPPVIEVPHTEEGEQAFSGLNLEPVAEAARPDAHQTSNAPEPSAVARITPTLIIPALPSSSSPKSSRAQRSLGEKLQDLSAKKAASNMGQFEEEKTKLKALISSADLRDPQTRQQLLAVLPTLQLSTTKWIADLVVQELSKLPLVLDKEESLRQKLAGLIAQGFELDERRHILLSEGSLAEENIQKVQEQKVELLAVEEQIKKLEAQAILLRAEIAIGEKRYSGFEASLDELDQLVEERQLNQLSVDSTSEEFLRTRAVSDSLCTAIFTHLRQLL